MSCRPRLTGGYKAATPAPRGAWAGVAEAGGAQRVPFLGAKLHGEVRGLRGQVEGRQDPQAWVPALRRVREPVNMYRQLRLNGQRGTRSAPAIHAQQLKATTCSWWQRVR